MEPGNHTVTMAISLVVSSVVDMVAYMIASLLVPFTHVSNEDATRPKSNIQ